MKKKLTAHNLAFIAALSAFVFFGAMLLMYPENAAEGAFKGLIISGRVLIPSLFPFSACVLFIIKSDLIKFPKGINRGLIKIFGMDSSTFLGFVFSFLGGYPIGAKLLDTLVLKGKISSKNAGLWINCFVNAGPAFIFAAAGRFGNKKKCLILLLSHIIPSLIMAALFGIKCDKSPAVDTAQRAPVGLGECIVSAISEAAGSVLRMCGFVIFFFALNSSLQKLSSALPHIDKLCCFTEVTAGVTRTDNIYFISFLLGFSGLCIWLQVFAFSKNIKKCIPLFALSRFFHGTLSLGFTKLFIMILSPEIATLGNGVSYSSKTFYSGLTLSLSMLMMIILLILSLNKKNYAGKLIDDML